MQKNFSNIRSLCTFIVINSPKPEKSLPRLIKKACYNQSWIKMAELRAGQAIAKKIEMGIPTAILDVKN